MFSAFRWLLFSTYVFAFFAAPLWILFDLDGLAIGTALAIASLIALRWRANRRILSRLGAKPWARSESPIAFTIVKELCRRLEVPAPRLYLLPSPAINVALFGFTPARRFLIVTEGAWTRLRRDEFAALVARQLVRLRKDQVTLDSWLSQFLSVIDRIVHGASRQPHTRKTRRFFLEQMQRLFLYPFCLIPIALLRDRRDTGSLDQAAIAVSRVPIALGEALRALESSMVRGGLSIAASDRPLFFVPPPTRDPFAEFLFPTEKLGRRILMLEGRSQTVTVG